MKRRSALRLGYLVPEFPSQTHAFFWREVLALRELGAVVHPISTRRPPVDASRHAFATTAAAQTRYLFPPAWWRSAAFLLAHPRRTLRALAYVGGLRETPLARRAALLGLLLPAADLVLHARQRRLDHLHVHSCANAAHVAALARLLGGPPYSLTLHGDLAVYGGDHRSKMGAAAFVACVTRPLQAQVQEATGLPAERAPVLWMGVNTRRFTAHGEAPVPDRQPLEVVTVARLNPMKGHRHALQALRLLVDRGVDVRYRIAGEGPERAAIEAEIARLGLAAQVQLLGTQGEDEILALLQRADVLLLPSVGAGEAAPVSVMEAMACGLPVVCSVIGGTADMIDDGVDGFLVPQGDAEAIAARLERLAKQPGLRLRIGRAARERAVESFDCSVLAGRLLGLVRRSRGDAQVSPVGQSDDTAHGEARARRSESAGA